MRIVTRTLKIKIMEVVSFREISGKFESGRVVVNRITIIVSCTKIVQCTESLQIFCEVGDGQLCVRFGNLENTSLITLPTSCQVSRIASRVSRGGNIWEKFN